MLDHSEDTPIPRQLRSIRSFVRRGGGAMGPMKQALWDQWASAYVVPAFQAAPCSSILSQIFGEKKRHYAMEIGFGNGMHLAHIAAMHPDIGYLGCDPYPPGVQSLLARVVENNLQNVRIWPHDMWELLPFLPAASLAHIYLLYPDPWPKRRHIKRRLFTHAFLDLCHRVLVPSGTLHIATDHHDYGVHIEASWCSHANVWRMIDPDPQHDPLTFGLVHTRYQDKAIRPPDTHRAWCLQR